MHHQTLSERKNPDPNAEVGSQYMLGKENEANLCEIPKKQSA